MIYNLNSKAIKYFCFSVNFDTKIPATISPGSNVNQNEETLLIKAGMVTIRYTIYRFLAKLSVYIFKQEIILILTAVTIPKYEHPNDTKWFCFIFI